MASRVINAVLKRWGPASAKQRIWDNEYRQGKWEHLDVQDRPDIGRDLIYGVLELYSSGASILDLGCGTASTALELKDDYRFYLGVDISEVAINKAVELVKSSPAHMEKAGFAVADIKSYDPGRKFDIILFRECLYYFPKPEVRKLLAHHSSALTKDGVFVVRLHDRVKYAPLVSLIEREYKVVERLDPPGATEIILVFKPSPEPFAGEQA